MGAYGAPDIGRSHTTGYDLSRIHNTAGPYSSDLANRANPRGHRDRGRLAKCSTCPLN